jgi:hypothetical protein
MRQDSARLRRAEVLVEVGQALQAGSTQASPAMARITDTPAPQGLPRAQGGLMEIEKYIRYAPFAVGLKPSARRGEARLRGL